MDTVQWFKLWLSSKILPIMNFFQSLYSNLKSYLKKEHVESASKKEGFVIHLLTTSIYVITIYNSIDVCP